MENKKTPKPGSPEYPVEETQKLNTPTFNSSGKKAGDELPPVENMNDQQTVIDTDNAIDVTVPHTNLGNPRDQDEDERERIIRR